MDLVTNAPPVVGEGAFCKEKIRREYELQRIHTSYRVRERDRADPSDIWCSVYLRRDVDHGGEDDHSVGMLTGWVEDEDVKNLEEDPQIPSHCGRTSWARHGGGGGKREGVLQVFALNPRETAHHHAM